MCAQTYLPDITLLMLEAPQSTLVRLSKSDALSIRGLLEMLVMPAQRVELGMLLQILLTGQVLQRKKRAYALPAMAGLVMETTPLHVCNVQQGSIR